MFGELKAKLATVEGKLKLLLATINGQVKMLETEVTSIDADVASVFGRVEGVVTKTNAQGTKLIADMRAKVASLSPKA